MIDTEDPGKSLRWVLAFAVRDWSQNRRDAWLWGIIHGWDDEAMAEMASQHDWTPEACARLRRLHAKFCEAFPEEDSCTTP